MKKMLLGTLVSSLTILLIGCSSNPTATEDSSAVDSKEQVTESKATETTEGKQEITTSETNDSEESVKLNDDEPEKDLSTLKEEALSFPIEIINYSILVQDDQFKISHPDLYSVTIKNNTTVDVKKVLIALMAWDSNNLPVKIKGNLSLNDGTYIARYAQEDINLVPQGIYGSDRGVQLDPTMTDLATLQPVILSYEDFDGNVVENTAATPFLDAIEGKKLSN